MNARPFGPRRPFTSNHRTNGSVRRGARPYGTGGTAGGTVDAGGGTGSVAMTEGSIEASITGVAPQGRAPDVRAATDGNGSARTMQTTTDPTDFTPTQFSLLSVARIVYLVHELRRELRRRENAATPAAVSS